MSDDFFGDLGKSITRATQKAAMRTGSLIESTKINALITAESKAVEKLYLELGELVYEQFEDGEVRTDSQILSIIDELDMHLEKISSYRAELAEVKGMKVCPSCGEIIETDALFCPKCGVSTLTGEQEAAEPAEEEDPYGAEEEYDDAEDEAEEEIEEEADAESAEPAEDPEETAEAEAAEEEQAEEEPEKETEEDSEEESEEEPEKSPDIPEEEKRE
ncbi:MAG: zinc ribbon domain-containing protein [Lachnospiraceae bacterium]|nr:zinc ribbon domain-containing protein [Lachnospiraceae bacterium]